MATSWTTTKDQNRNIYTCTGLASGETTDPLPMPNSGILGYIVASGSFNASQVAVEVAIQAAGPWIPYKVGGNDVVFTEADGAELATGATYLRIVAQTITAVDISLTVKAP